jgi:uncharacterized protein YbjT (DUF2867 family)
MNGDLILVVGGTGHLGRDLVGELLKHGRRVRVFARSPGTDTRVEWARGDLSTGDGLRDALRGVHTVVNAATFSPIAQRGSIRPIDFLRTPTDVDVHGTQRLLDEARRACVAHFLHVSIAGLDPRSPLPYNRVKLQGENLVRSSDLPWSIVHATPFFYLLARLFLSMRWMPFWLLPGAPAQPVDTSDVAKYLVSCLSDAKLGVREPIGGPEAKPMSDFARDYLAARSVRRRVFSMPTSATRAARMGLVTVDGFQGSVTWRDWLQTHQDEPKGRVGRSSAGASTISA